MATNLQFARWQAAYDNLIEAHGLLYGARVSRTPLPGDTSHSFRSTLMQRLDEYRDAVVATDA